MDPIVSVLWWVSTILVEMHTLGHVGMDAMPMVIVPVLSTRLVRAGYKIQTMICLELSSIWIGLLVCQVMAAF